jgi:hypothetical protein
MQRLLRERTSPRIDQLACRVVEQGHGLAE